VTAKPKPLALDAATVDAVIGSGYPEPFKSRRHAAQAAVGPDDDIAGRATPRGRSFTRKDGTPY
jgi:hypothetical protein